MCQTDGTATNFYLRNEFGDLMILIIYLLNYNIIYRNLI